MTVTQFRAQKLTPDARARILASVRAKSAVHDEIATESKRPRLTSHRSRRITAVAIAVAVLAAATLGIGALTDLFGNLRAKSHQPSDGSSRIEAPIETQNDDYVLVCDAISGGANQLYLSLVLTRTDGGEVFDLPDGCSLGMAFFESAYLESDGTRVKIYPLLIKGSSAWECRIEASTLLVGENKRLHGRDVVLHLGSADLTAIDKNGECTIITQDFGDLSLTVTLPEPQSILERRFEPISFEVDGATVTLDRMILDGAELRLLGSTDGDEFPSLHGIMTNTALVRADRREILCGGKGSAGTNRDGDFELCWLIAEVVTPDEIAAIRIAGELRTLID